MAFVTAIVGLNILANLCFISCSQLSHHNSNSDGMMANSGQGQGFNHLALVKSRFQRKLTWFGTARLAEAIAPSMRGQVALLGAGAYLKHKFNEYIRESEPEEPTRSYSAVSPMEVARSKLPLAGMMVANGEVYRRGELAHKDGVKAA